MKDLCDRLDEYHRAAVNAAALFNTYPVDCWHKRRALAQLRLAESFFTVALANLREGRALAPAPAPPPPPPPPAPKPLAVTTLETVPLDATPSAELIAAARDVARFGYQDVPADQGVRIPVRFVRVLGVTLARLKR